MRPTLEPSPLSVIARNLGWPAPAVAALDRAKIFTVGDVAQYSPEALRRELEPLGVVEPLHFFAILVRHPAVKAAL